MLTACRRVETSENSKATKGKLRTETNGGNPDSIAIGSSTDRQ